MSFRFNFNIEEDENQVEGVFGTESNQKVNENEDSIAPEAFQEISSEHLLDSLPSQLSCSPIQIPLTSGKTRNIARRDLFDARFQLISDGTGVDSEAASTSALAFIEQPSDLVPWVYEGGLKTWECSLDVVDYLEQLKARGEFSAEGKRILEIGCGTAVPSIYILNELFNFSNHKHDTEIHLQDYNASALELVTFPNILLAWYMSSASDGFRSSQRHAEDGTDANVFPPPDPSVSSEISITDELKTAFQASLYEHRIKIRFFSGSWSTFDVNGTGGRYDVVLTSETVYRQESVPSLIDLMHHACEGNIPDSTPPSYLCLVAAKVFYFGVGGGVTEFVQAIQRKGNPVVDTVWEQTIGVGRKILRVSWARHS